MNAYLRLISNSGQSESSNYFQTHQMSFQSFAGTEDVSVSWVPKGGLFSGGLTMILPSEIVKIELA